MAALQPLINRLRPGYRRLRTAYLRRRYPRGGYVEGNGVRVFADFHLESYAWYDADAPNLAFAIRVLEQITGQAEGDVWIDVGAHFGFFSAVMARLLRGRAAAMIIAIEPDPRNFRCLGHTLRDVAVRTVLLPVAVGDHDGTVDLFATDAPCLHTYADDSARVVGRVESLRLDTIVHRYTGPRDRVGLVKVDIDGAEPYFLRGAEETLARHRPIVIVEWYPSGLRKGGFDPRELFERVTSRFVVYWVSESSVRRVVAADYEALEREVGGRVADLIFSPRMLDLSTLGEAPSGGGGTRRLR